MAPPVLNHLPLTHRKAAIPKQLGTLAVNHGAIPMDLSSQRPGHVPEPLSYQAMSPNTSGAVFY